MNNGTLVSVVAAMAASALLAGMFVAHQASQATRPAAGSPTAGALQTHPDYLRAAYSPLHFKPAIDMARDEQCLACHQEVLTDKVRERSPAGQNAQAVKAWYQQLDTYEGEQDTFHRRHLVTPLAKRLMNLRCNTCHQGHDPREEAPSPPTGVGAGYTLRKQVDPETICLKCHGQMGWENMGLPGPWEEAKEAFQNNCLICHATIRTVRHQVIYLNAAAIEEAGKSGADACHGCHGGRAWYRIAYPYPRHAWPGMPEQVPDWAKGRPAESEARFRFAAEGQTVKR
jgi:nitrate/TMAO reductase-like tetraheme cytochrome c subunit